MEEKKIVKEYFTIYCPFSAWDEVSLINLETHIKTDVKGKKWYFNEKENKYYIIRSIQKYFLLEGEKSCDSKIIFRQILTSEEDHYKYEFIPPNNNILQKGDLVMVYNKVKNKTEYKVFDPYFHLSEENKINWIV